MIRDAIILAGGEGTRLRPVTLEIPKPLVPVQGVPIATWLVRLFAKHGVEKVTVIYPTKWKQKFEEWRDIVGAQFTVSKVELFEEKEPMGTMGALVHELKLGDEPVYVTNGDELKGLNLTELATFHHARHQEDKRHTATVALIHVPNPSDYGVAEMNGHRITRFHEKPVTPPSNLISSGLYIVHPQVFVEVVQDKRFLMFEKDLFPQLAIQGRLVGCRLDGPWYDCGTMERWEKAIHEWKGFDIERNID